MVTVRQAILNAQQQLSEVTHIPTQEARRLLSYFFDKPLNWIYTEADALVPSDIHQQFMEAVSRRQSGYPLAYILGSWNFFQWDFIVNEHVLIPRPETELLVEIIKADITDTYANTDINIIDIGTGSGAIAISLSLLFPQATVSAVDISDGALDVAKQNNQRLGSHVNFTQSDLLTNVSPQVFEVIVANLPYISPEDLEILTALRFEPSLALDGGSNGTIYIDKLLKQSQHYVEKGSKIYLEIGSDQGEAVVELAAQYFPKASVSLIQDLNQLDRIVKITVDK